ncbi:hypothetical protein [Nocardioides sp.]|uniref:hypothetical protein n=1 Tax=Nocardioides sp. TaxID=35761 RepID=UPI00378469B8
MNEFEEPGLAVTIVFRPATEELGASASDASIRGSITAGSQAPIPFTGWLELMGELERLVETTAVVQVDPAHRP